MRININKYKIATLILTIILIICVVILIRDYFARKNANDIYGDLGKDKPQSTEALITEENSEIEDTKPLDPIAERGIEIPAKALDWEQIIAANSDIYAWIYIPGTNVDYPILQSATDDSYYLEHNLDGSKGYPGCIYTESYNSKDFTDHNTVIYGHNMKDGSMFHTLHSFEDKNFFEENRYAFIYMPDGKVFVYDLFAAYTFTDEHILQTYILDTDESMQEYLDVVYSYNTDNSNFREGVTVTGQSNIITLSTCIGGMPENRLLVQGVLIGIRYEDLNWFDCRILLE